MENMEKMTDRLLEKINKKIAEFIDPDDSYQMNTLQELPEIEQKDKDILKSEKIIIVDDDNRIILHRLPYLMAATDGNADAVLSNLTKNELVDKILAKNPTIILLDNDLGYSYTGPEICKILKTKTDAKIFGHSGSISSAKMFEQNGASGFILKDAAEYIIPYLTHQLKTNP